MDAYDQLHVVVGATGGAGGALVRELAGRGHRVRAVSRKPAGALPEGVEQLAADAADPAQMRTACQGAAVVYHCAQPPYERWVALFPPLTASIAQAAAAAGARLVYADNLYAYGPVAGPITEDLPALATTRKGRVRTLMAERLLAAHRSGTLQVAIGRSSDYCRAQGRPVRVCPLCERAGNHLNRSSHLVRGAGRGTAPSVDSSSRPRQRCSARAELRGNVPGCWPIPFPSEDVHVFILV